jgi:hypothetical protein
VPATSPDFHELIFLADVPLLLRFTFSRACPLGQRPNLSGCAYWDVRLAGTNLILSHCRLARHRRTAKEILTARFGLRRVFHLIDGDAVRPCIPHPPESPPALAAQYRRWSSVNRQLGVPRSAYDFAAALSSMSAARAAQLPHLRSLAANLCP